MEFEKLFRSVHKFKCHSNNARQHNDDAKWTSTRPELGGDRARVGVGEKKPRDISSSSSSRSNACISFRRKSVRCCHENTIWMGQRANILAQDTNEYCYYFHVSSGFMCSLPGALALVLAMLRLTSSRQHAAATKTKTKRTKAATGWKWNWNWALGVAIVLDFLLSSTTTLAKGNCRPHSPSPAWSSSLSPVVCTDKRDIFILSAIWIRVPFMQQFADWNLQADPGWAAARQSLTDRISWSEVFYLSPVVDCPVLIGPILTVSPLLPYTSRWPWNRNPLTIERCLYTYQ